MLARGASPSRREPAARLERCTEAFARYCLRYPAFLDCSLSLMRRPGARAARDRLGVGLAAPRPGHGRLHRRTSRGSCATGPRRRFDVEDPDYIANVLWTQVLGVVHLARIGVGVRQAAPGVPALFAVEREQLVETCVRSTRALVADR